VAIENQAKRYFNSGYNCAESVLLAVNEQLDSTRGSNGSLIPRIATGFGGGIARNGDTCGAVTGGVMAISLALGRDTSEESRDPCYPAVDQFYNDFVKTFGTCKCHELTGIELKKATGMEAYHSRIHKVVCNPIVAWAAKSASRIIQNED
jgi:C_GCAxxG_C_C family probable redox protein